MNCWDEEPSEISHEGTYRFEIEEWLLQWTSLQNYSSDKPEIVLKVDS